MKLLKNQPKNSPRRRVKKVNPNVCNRTADFGKDLLGRSNAGMFSSEDFAAAIGFCEAALNSAHLLFDRLVLGGTEPATAEIGEHLKRAQASFEAFRARTLPTPMTVAP